MDDAINESALVIAVPEAEALVGQWRTSLDPACRRGVPAHVTLLYPFAPPSNIDEGIVQALRELFRDVEPFSFSLETTAWFGERVVYLEPRPDTAFRALTSRLRERFPHYLPYGGTVHEPTPHLTLGDGALLERLEEADEAVSIGLPLRVHSTAAWLMTGGRAPQSWTTRDTFALGRGS